MRWGAVDSVCRVTGTAESIGPNELREQSDFLDACMATPVMQHAHRWLAGRQLIGGSPQQFKDALTQMWFSLYRRNVQNDSCGFEHVFLGESDDGQVKVRRKAMPPLAALMARSAVCACMLHAHPCPLLPGRRLMPQQLSHSTSSGCLTQGLHSWIQFHLEERNGHLEYRGYLNPHGCVCV